MELKMIHQRKHMEDELLWGKKQVCMVESEGAKGLEGVGK